MFSRDKKLTGREKLIDVSKKQEIDNDPIIQYNHVVECYNAEENRTFSVYMDFMNYSGIYNKMSKIILNPCALMIYIIAMIIPIVGIFMFLILFYAIIRYFSNLRTFNKNKLQVSQPFTNMIFSPELCRSEGIINKFYEINANGNYYFIKTDLKVFYYIDLNQFNFNPEIINALKAKEFQGKIKFMVYDGKFYDYFYNYPKLKSIHIFGLLLSLGMMVAQGYIDWVIDNDYMPK